jgi:molybdate transport system substrate-binding protein
MRWPDAGDHQRNPIRRGESIMREPFRAIASIIGLALLVGCSAVQPGGTINVYAAASLTEAFEDIGRAFEETNPGSDVVFNFAGSQQLATQINEGAPAHVFASANAKQMDAVIAGGRISVAQVTIFARNRLVVITPPDNPGGIDTLRDLARPGLRLVLAADVVPVGGYSLTVLDNAAAAGYGADFRQRVLANVVCYEDNVRGVVSKIALGEADGGIVYATDAATAAVRSLAIDEPLNVVASYPIAALDDAGAGATAFVAYVASADGQAVLARHGFGAAP